MRHGTARQLVAQTCGALVVSQNSLAAASQSLSVAHWLQLLLTQVASVFALAHVIWRAGALRQRHQSGVVVVVRSPRAIRVTRHTLRTSSYYALAILLRVAHLLFEAHEPVTRRESRSSRC